LVVFTKRVVAGSDDAEQESTGTMSLTSSDLELQSATSDQETGMRWTGVTIPKDATINSATIQFHVDEINAESALALTITFTGEDIDDAPTFTTTDNDITDRTDTSASVNWAVPTWIAEHDEGAAQLSADISTIVQEIVDRGGWASGNAMVIMIGTTTASVGTGERVAESFEGEPGAAPELSVDFTPSGMQTKTFTVDAKLTKDGQTKAFTIDATIPDPNECPHQFVEVTTDQMHTGDTVFTDIPGAVIDSSFFVTGRKYLIVVTTQAVGSNINTNYGVTTLHGSTGFDGAEHVFEPNAVATRSQYSYHTVWTAIASEGVKMQFKTTNAAQTVSADQTTLFALEISEKFTEGVDWHSSQILATTTLATTPSTANNATITFTPPVAGNDWLVISGGCVDTDALNINYISRTARSGEATSTSPSTSQEGEDASLDLYVQTLFRVFNLGNASNTFEQEAFKSGSQGPAATREYSSIFAINLNKFSSHSNVYTDGGITLDTTDDLSTSTQVQTDTLAPSIAGNTWVLGSFVTGGNAFQEIRARMQIDNADQPPTQTSDNYKQLLGYDPIDENNWALQTVEDLDTSSHTTDIDVTAETGSPSDRTAMFRSIFELRLSKLAPTVQTKPFTVDALLQATQTKVFTIDSILAGTEEFDVNAILVVPNAETFTVDALLQVTQTFNFTIDAFLQKTQTKAFTIDALLQATQTKVFTVDAMLRAENVVNFTVDGLRENSPEKMFLINALLQDTFIEDFEVDSIVVERNTETFTVDSIVVDRNVEDFLVDAKIVRIELFDVDAKVINRNTEDFEVDAILQATFTEDFLVDAFPQAQQVFNFTVDAFLVDAFTKVFLVDAFLLDVFTEEFEVDGLIVLQGIVAFPPTIVDAHLEPQKLFCDFFNRADNITLGPSDIPGNNWIESEVVPGVGPEIVSNKMAWLAVQNVNNRNEPIATNDFSKVTSGKLKWQFEFDFDRGTDNDFRITMQLGDGALFVDPNTSTSTGVAVVLQYASQSRGMTDLEGFGHGFEPSLVQDARTKGLVTVDVTVDFGSQTYNINVRGPGFISGNNLTTGIPFINSVGIDTIRLYSDLLSAIAFSDKTIDDMCIFVPLEATQSFSVDGVIKKTQEEQFTVDALLQDTFTETFKVDSLISQAPDKFFLVSAFIQDTFTKDFTIDTIISSRIPFEFTVNSIIEARKTEDFTIDSCLRQEQTETFEVDALIAEINTKDFIIDGFLTETPIEDFTVNSLLIQGQVLNFIVDSFLSEGNVKNFLVNALVKALGQVELFEVGVKTKATQTEDFTVNSLLKELGQTFDFTLDSQLELANTETFSVDSHLRAVQTKTFEIDSILNLENTAVFTIDGRVAVTRNFTVDAFIALVKQFTVGPLIKGAQTKDFQVNGITFIPPAVLICIDARLRVRNDKDFSVDAGLETVNTKEFVVDGLPKALQTEDFTVDSQLTAGATQAFSVDANLILVQTKDFTVDAQFPVGNMVTFEVDAFTQRRRLTGWNNDALIKALGQTFDFTIDAQITSPNTVIFTLDAVFPRQQFNNRTVDALLKELGRTFDFTVGARTLGIQTETFSVDAILRAEFTTNFTIDGISFIPPAVVICVGPIIQFTAVEGIEIDSKLIVRKDTSFSIDAVLAVTVTNTFDFEVDSQILQLFNAKNFTIDSIIFTPKTRIYLLDAILKRRSTRSFLIDTTDLHFVQTEDFAVDSIFLGATLSTTFSVDSVLLATQTELVDINALIASRNTTTFVVDSISFIPPAVTFLVHGFAKAFNQTEDFILDANIRIVQLETLDVDSVLQAIQTEIFTVDALLRDTFTKVTTIDAKLVRTNIFSIDSLIQRLGTNCRAGVLLSDDFSSDSGWLLTSTGNSVEINSTIPGEVFYNGFGNFVNGRYYKDLDFTGGLSTINTLEDFRIEFKYNRDSIALSGSNGPHLMGLTNVGGIMASQQFFGVQANIRLYYRRSNYITKHSNIHIGCCIPKTTV